MNNAIDNQSVHPFMQFLFLRNTFSLLFLGMIIVVGAMAWNGMVRESSPDLAIPQATITTEWAGAAPEQIEKQISQELEKKIRGLKGLKRVESGSFNSYSIVTVEFHADEDINSAMSLLRAKVDEAQAEFPSVVKKPKVEQISVNDTPVISYMLSGDLPEETIQSSALNLKNQLEQLKGVRKVIIAGEREGTVYVRLRPERLRSLDISPSMVRQRIEAANLDAAWGRYEAKNYNLELYFSARFSNIEMLKQLAITQLAPGRIIRLGEIAEIEQRLEKPDVKTSFSYKSQTFKNGVSLEVLKSAGGDSLAIIERVKQSINESSQKSTWPFGMQATISNDSGDLIRESFDEIFNNVWQASLAVFVILFFLLTWRESTIAGLAIPLTLLASLGVIWGLGNTLNSMVMIGMVLALGMLVDVFILVMEGMHDGLYLRKLNFAQSAIRTVKTFAKPAFAGQLTTILALVPLMAVGGVDGKFIRVLPITVIVCLLSSFVIAFLLCIPLSRFLLDKKKDKAEATFVDLLTEKFSNKLKLWLIAVPLINRKIAGAWVFGSALLLVLSLQSLSLLPVEMYPKGDGRNLGITIELPSNATLEQSERIGELAGSYLQSTPWFESVTRYIGRKSPLATGSLKESLLPDKSPNIVGFSAIFLPKEEREKLSFTYLNEIRAGLEKALVNEVGLKIVFTPDVGGSTSDDPIQILLQGPDINKLAKLSEKVQSALYQVPGTTDVRDNLGQFQIQVRFTPIQEALSFHGLTESELATQIRMATEFDEIGKFKRTGTQDDLTIRIGTYWESRGKSIGGPKYLSELATLQIVTSKGELVPLGSLVDYGVVKTPQVLVHTDSVRTVTVRARTEGRTALSILDDFQPKLDMMKADWPPEYSYIFAGEAESTEETFGQMGIAFVVAILLVFSVLTLLFSSFAQPLIILSSVPLAMTGTFAGFFFSGQPMSFTAVIGMVTLVGIVVNDAIVMVETINEHRANGMSVKEAAACGSSERLRPILSTTITTVVGLIPLALSSPMWYPLAMAIVYGLMFSTLVALVIVPVLYLLLNRDITNVINDSNKSNNNIIQPNLNAEKPSLL